MKTPQTLAKGNYLTLVSQAGWEYVIRHRATGVVILVAATPEHELVLVEQYRPPVNSVVLELPAGLVGDEESTEDTLDAARRELLEETGFAAAKLELLVTGPSSPGMAAEIVTFYRATGLSRQGDGGGVEGENITVQLAPLDQIDEFLAARAASGVLVDPKIYAALHFLRA